MGLASGAAVAVRCLIDRLRRLWNYLRGLARRRNMSTVIPVTEGEERVPTSRSPQLHRDRPHHHVFKPERLRRQVPQVEQPSRPSTPPLVVNGCCVPKDIETKYREYFTLSTLIPENSVLCHMCFFDMQRHENCTVLKSKILLHCCHKHSIGLPCKYRECKVRLPTQSDLDLHLYFCH